MITLKAKLDGSIHVMESIPKISVANEASTMCLLTSTLYHRLWRTW